MAPALKSTFIRSALKLYSLLARAIPLRGNCDGDGITGLWLAREYGHAASGAPFSPALRLVRPIHNIRGFYDSRAMAMAMAIRGLLLPLKGRCMAIYSSAVYHHTRVLARSC